MMRTLFHFIFRDIGRKLLALLFAALLYGTISVQLGEERDLSKVPVVVHYASGLMDMSPRPYMVNVTVRAPKYELTDLKAVDFTATVEVGPDNLVNGIYQVNLTPENFKTYRSAKVVRIDPTQTTLRFNLQPRLSRDARVVAAFEGSLSPEFRVADVRCSPAVVRVSGPENMMAGITRVETAPVPLSSKVRESFEFESKILPPFATEVFPDNVKIFVDIERSFDVFTFKNLPVAVMTGPEHQRLDVSLADPATRVEVTVKGPPSAIAALKPEDIRPYVDVSGITKPGIHVLEPACRVIPGGVEYTLISPGEIKVKISRVK